ncbi:MAG: hypothetical protein AAFX44_04475 [Pseudomonadota bacterium]
MDSDQRFLTQLRAAFPVLADRKRVSDGEIRGESHPLMLQTDVDDFDVLPFYMQWCVRHPGSADWVAEGTLDAIATYGRTNNPRSPYAAVKPRCNERQVLAIRAFLAWRRDSNTRVDEKRLERALRYW